MEFHNVAFEKDNAMRRYRRKRKVEHALRFFKLCVLLLVLSRSSWFPTILKIFHHLYAEFISLFNHPFYVFLLGNVIILFIYALSDKNDGPNDVYDEFLTNTEPRPKTKPDSEPPVDPPICSELVESPVPAETVTAVSETTQTRTTTTSSCTRVGRTMNGEKFSKSKCYRRVQSESFSRRIVVGSGPELKRLNTEKGREMVRYGGELETRLCSVEKLSKEDFNRTVEDFIAKHRRMQWEEHREYQETEYFLSPAK